jgi:putative peptidoglycan lipid II flippase
MKAFVALYRARLRRIAVIAAVATGLAVVCVPPLLALVAAQRPVTGSGASLGLLLLALGGVAVFGSLGALVSASYYALGDTSTPTLVSIGTFTLFIIGKLLIFERYGLYPFCILTSAYYAVNVLVLGVLLERRLAHGGSP